MDGARSGLVARVGAPPPGSRPHPRRIRHAVGTIVGMFGSRNSRSSLRYFGWRRFSRRGRVDVVQGAETSPGALSPITT